MKLLFIAIGHHHPLEEDQTGDGKVLLDNFARITCSWWSIRGSFEEKLHDSTDKCCDEACEKTAFLMAEGLLEARIYEILK